MRLACLPLRSYSLFTPVYGATTRRRSGRLPKLFPSPTRSLARAPSLSRASRILSARSPSSSSSSSCCCCGDGAPAPAAAAASAPRIAGGRRSTCQRRYQRPRGLHRTADCRRREGRGRRRGRTRRRRRVRRRTHLPHPPTDRDDDDDDKRRAPVVTRETVGTVESLRSRVPATR